MTDQTFAFVIDTLKSAYSTAHGVIGQLKVTGSRYPWSLCVSTMRNAGKLIPDSCILWDSEKLKFQGKLSSCALKRRLDKADPCRLEITNSEDMESGSGDFICLKDPCSCTQKCPCNVEGYFEELCRKHPEYRKKEVKMKQPEFKSVIKDAFTSGFKEAKHDLKNDCLFGRYTNL